MATKQTKKTVGSKSPKGLLKQRNRFSLSTLLILVGVLSVVGYFVLTTFAAGPAHLSGSCPKKVENESQYACYRDSAEGWSTRIYRVVLNRNPDPTGQTYWSNQINTKGVSTSANALIASSNTPTSKSLFFALDANAKTDAVYSRTLNRPADQSGKAYWSGRFSKEPAGDVITAFLSTDAVKKYDNHFLADKVLDYMAPGWRVTVVNPPTCEQTGTCPQPTCEQTGTCPQPTCEETGTCPPAQEPTDSTFVIPSDGAPSVDGGSSDALTSLGEVSLDELSNASPDQIEKIIQDQTGSTDSTGSEAAARSYGGKLKILPPSQAVSDGADEMRYYLNGKLKATVKKAPYTYTIDTTRLKNARYALTIVPYQGGEKQTEYTYVLSVKNNLNFWQKIYNVITAPFSK